MLNDLVETLVRDHPFHVLFQLISLRNSEKVKPRARDAPAAAESPRVVSVKTVLARFHRNDSAKMEMGAEAERLAAVRPQALPLALSRARVSDRLHKSLLRRRHRQPTTSHCDRRCGTSAKSE